MDTGRPRRIVVGVDNTLSGLQALHRAVQEARVHGLPLNAVHAWRPGPRARYPSLADQRRAESDTASQLVATAFADAMGGLPVDVEVETVLVPDAPGPALTGHTAREGDLLVLGAARGGFWRRLLRRGRVTRYCLARATCPVLVVPPPPLTRTSSPRALLRELNHDLELFTRDPADH